MTVIDDNKQICIAPSGENFTEAGAKQGTSERRKGDSHGEEECFNLD